MAKQRGVGCQTCGAEGMTDWIRMTLRKHPVWPHPALRLVLGTVPDMKSRRGRTDRNGKSEEIHA